MKKVQKNSKKFKKPLDKSEDKWYNVQAVREKGGAEGKASGCSKPRPGQREALRSEPESIKYSGAKCSGL